jgi:peptidoglycan/xylan/chitin deacetylase (PgdA/CDA1 family)
MSTGHHSPRRRSPRTWLRQLVTGLVALPLSALPFAAYVTMTPEGRLVLDRATVALNPPQLPELPAPARAAISDAAPTYEGQVMALAYHGIGSSSDGEGGFVISPGRFAEHLAALDAAGMRTVTAAQVATAFGGGTPLPPKAVMITFDDGRTDAMLFADTLLEQARMRATMFVITGAASEPGIYYASWDKLEDYAESGRWDLQSHTATLHRDHDTGAGDLPALTSLELGETLEGYRARVREDLAKASDAIENHTGRAPVAFAYPFGAYGAERTNDPAIRGVLREEVERRYALAFHQDDQESVPLVRDVDDRLSLRRLEVGKWSGLELVRRIARAADRTPGLDPAPPPAPDAVADVPLTDAQAPPTTTTVAPPASPPSTRPPSTTTPPRRQPATTAPAPTAPTTAPPATAPPGTTVPPATTPTTVGPSTTTTTTTAPAPTTTTTTKPKGCRSHGGGGVCRPD